MVYLMSVKDYYELLEEINGKGNNSKYVIDFLFDENTETLTPIFIEDLSKAQK